MLTGIRYCLLKGVLEPLVILYPLNILKSNPPLYLLRLFLSKIYFLLTAVIYSSPQNNVIDLPIPRLSESSEKD
jgi:hypothetical protein